jgi:hypothetical protein
MQGAHPGFCFWAFMSRNTSAREINLIWAIGAKNVYLQFINLHFAAMQSAQRLGLSGRPNFPGTTILFRLLGSEWEKLRYSFAEELNLVSSFFSSTMKTYFTCCPRPEAISLK